MRQEAYDRHRTTNPGGPPAPAAANAFAANVLINARNVQLADHLRSLYAHLLENHYVDSIVGFDKAVLHIFSRDVLHRIRTNDPSWETMVPGAVAAAIKQRGLFGHAAP
jgi:hypothetical protein